MVILSVAKERIFYDPRKGFPLKRGGNFPTRYLSKGGHRLSQGLHGGRRGGLQARQRAVPEG